MITRWVGLQTSGTLRGELHNLKTTLVGNSGEESQEVGKKAKKQGKHQKQYDCDYEDDLMEKSNK